jgi:hypothetical protein
MMLQSIFVVLVSNVDMVRLQDWRWSTLCKVETPIHDRIRELVTWECKEHGVKS